MTVDESGKGCTPHLPPDKFKLDETIAVPARRGDVVCFNIFTVHGSHINTTDRMRRLVRWDIARRTMCRPRVKAEAGRVGAFGDIAKNVRVRRRIQRIKRAN